MPRRKRPELTFQEHIYFEVTNQLKAAGSVVGIALLDHIIFNRSDYFSFLEAGRL